MLLENLLNDEKRKIAEMLVIYRVELVLLHESHQVGKLHRDDATGLQQIGHSGNEIVDIGDVGQDAVEEVLPADHVRRPRT